MTLEELIDEIIDVTEQLNRESIDYEKISVLHTVLYKLIDCYNAKCDLSETKELDVTCWQIINKLGKVRSTKSREVLCEVYTFTVSKLYENLLPSLEGEQLNKIVL